MLIMPKGAGWKTPMVPRVAVISMVPRVLVMLEGMPDEVVGHDRLVSSLVNLWELVFSGGRKPEAANHEITHSN